MTLSTDKDLNKIHFSVLIYWVLWATICCEISLKASIWLPLWIIEILLYLELFEDSDYALIIFMSQG